MLDYTWGHVWKFLQSQQKDLLRKRWWNTFDSMGATILEAASRNSYQSLAQHTFWAGNICKDELLPLHMSDILKDWI